MLLLQNGETVLHVASRKGDVKAVKILTRAGADINMTNKVSCALSLEI